MADIKKEYGMVQIPDTDLVKRVKDHCKEFGGGIGKFFQIAAEDHLAKERAIKGLPPNKPEPAS